MVSFCDFIARTHSGTSNGATGIRGEVAPRHGQQARPGEVSSAMIGGTETVSGSDLSIQKATYEREPRGLFKLC